MKDNQDRFEFPGLPELNRAEYEWEGEIDLPGWAGFQSRRGAYAGRSDSAPSNGRFRIAVSSDDLPPSSFPTEAQISAMKYLLENEAVVAAAILQAIWDDYPERRELYCGNDPDWEEFMPQLDHLEEFKDLIGLSAVLVSSGEREGVAYVGFEFGCKWDEEHGHGVMTHKNRVVAVGSGDIAFTGAWNDH